MNQAITAEQQRLFALHSLELLDSEPSEAFDRITRLAAHIFDVPTCLVSLVDSERQWFKSRVGLELRETCREDALCDHTIRSVEVMVVPDAKSDERFTENPLVIGPPYLRFYAGAPLILNTGEAIGSLCVIDIKPRQFDPSQQRTLRDLAALVVAQIELQRSIGRVDGVTHLPNKAQLTLDMLDSCRAHENGECTLAVLELMEYSALSHVALALGSSSLDDLMREAGRQIHAFAAGRFRIYYLDTMRLAIFALGLDGTAREDLMEQLLELARRFSGPADVFALEHKPCIGATVFDLNREEAEDSIRRATTALYRGRAGNLSTVWYDTRQDQASRRSYRLLRDLSQAAASDQFTLVFQPQLDVATLQYKSAEALLRWTHPGWGAVSPGEFIPLVENTSLIYSITEWVLNAALARLAQWDRQGLSIDIAINVSARNLEDTGFIEMVMNTCGRHAISPARLLLECTENMVLVNSPILKTIQQAQALGIQFALDDFGTGYCNFASLYNLPVRILKLDRSLISPIATDERAFDIVKSMVSIGHKLGYRLVAEGVENSIVFDRLIETGCDEIQGYYVSRPLVSEKAFTCMKIQNDTFRHTPVDFEAVIIENDQPVQITG